MAPSAPAIPHLHQRRMRRSEVRRSLDGWLAWRLSCLALDVFTTDSEVGLDRVDPSYYSNDQRRALVIEQALRGVTAPPSRPGWAGQA
ncbi:hypothetical protein ACRALDRAFT_2020988 [Sodiomyces alcalophilus JCM 7366]|uniref:uncharacterized protein n=1 Tax=Sodiomyces alcalophilus JCM 7366 TaxID=591952 RepID=UPI0039B64C22